MLEHPAGGGQRTKRAMREVPLLHRLLLARKAPEKFLVREVPKFHRLALAMEVPANFLVREVPEVCQ